MLKRTQVPKTVLGLKLKLIIVMLIQLIGWSILSISNFPRILGDESGNAIAIVSILVFIVTYFILSIGVFNSKIWAKKILANINLVLIALAVYFPLFHGLLSGNQLISMSHNYNVSQTNSILLAEQLLRLDVLWSNLLVLFSASIILNLLRKHTLFKLWDDSVLGRREYIHDRMSLGNSFILGIFLSLGFYSLIIILPNNPDIFKNIKHLFFGNHIMYYLIVIIFFWVVAILWAEYSTVKNERAILQEVKDFFTHQGVGTIRYAEAFELKTEFEKRFWPITHSPITYKIYRLFNTIETSRTNQLDNILERLMEIEFQAIEFSRGFLNTLLWSLPLLGFMGTILGIIDTIGAFGDVLTEGKNASSLIGSLKGLSLAFETTLLGLISALIANYFFAMVKRMDEQNSVTLSQICEDEIIDKISIQKI